MVDGMQSKVIRDFAPRRGWLLGALLAVAFGALLGCEEDAAPEFLFPSAWKGAGLEVASFDQMKEAPFGKGTCWAGKVAKIDTVICRYEKPEQAKAARADGLAYVGAHTGVSLNSGVWLIAVADRESVDPTGKDINRIATVFLNHAQVKPKPDKPESGKEGEKSSKAPAAAEQKKQADKP